MDTKLFIKELKKNKPDDRIVDRLVLETSRKIAKECRRLEKTHPGFKASVSTDFDPFKNRFNANIKLLKVGVCRVCGCTETDPCYNPLHGFCWWADATETICSHCASKEIAEDPFTCHCVNSTPAKPSSIGNET